MLSAATSSITALTLPQSSTRSKHSARGDFLRNPTSFMIKEPALVRTRSLEFLRETPTYLDSPARRMLPEPRHDVRI